MVSEFEAVAGEMVGSCSVSVSICSSLNTTSRNEEGTMSTLRESFPLSTLWFGLEHVRIRRLWNRRNGPASPTSRKSLVSGPNA